MDNEIFRKKSLDTINSPESLNDYIRVASPGVWLILLAVIALLAGAVIWGIFGRIDTVLKAEACLEDGQLVCYVSDARAGEIAEGMPVRVGEAEGKVSEVGDFDAGENGRKVVLKFAETPEEGEAEIVIESLRPFSLAFD